MKLVLTGRAISAMAIRSFSIIRWHDLWKLQRDLNQIGRVKMFDFGDIKSISSFYAVLVGKNRPNKEYGQVDSVIFVDIRGIFL